MKFLVGIFLLYALAYSDLIFACLPNEIHVRESHIKEYRKQSGVVVSSHVRSEHCREIKVNNYFENSPKDKIKGLETKFKGWTKDEMEQLIKQIESLPTWLKRYKLIKILRADEQIGNSNNPAMVIPSAKTLIIFDKFFKMPNKKDIITHEMAHIAVWDMDPVVLKSFFVARGWRYEEKGKIVAPDNVILPDSKDSPSEDFANSIELYYSNKLLLQSFNPLSFQILEKIIESKESHK